MVKDLDRRFILIVAGVTAMVVSGLADSTALGYRGFGIVQLSGFLIGSAVTIAGLVTIYFPDVRIPARLLAGMYMSGILYMGLRPQFLKYTQHNVKVLLHTASFQWYDIAINTLGFIPFGYLLMASFRYRQKNTTTKMYRRAVVVAGTGCFISLFLEVTQYYLISGRVSSLFDWISNTLGTLVGIAVYFALGEKSKEYAETRLPRPLR